MKSATTALDGLLSSNNQLFMADLITIITLQNGTLYLSSSDVDISWNGHIFTSNGIQFTRSKIKCSIGVNVDELDISFYGNSSTLVNGQSFLQAAIAGVFDGAQFKLERAFMQTYGSVVGTLIQFVGVVGQIDTGRTESKFKIMSNLYLLNVQMPKNVYQAGCINTLYDASCGLTRTPVTGVVTTGSTAKAINCSGSASIQATGYFNLGYISFTSGANNGLTRTINSSSTGVINLLNPLPNVLANGDTFSAYFGCDKQMATCNSRLAITSAMGAFCSFATNVMAVVIAPAIPFDVGQTINATGISASVIITAQLTLSTYSLSATVGTLSTRSVTATGNLGRFRGFPFIPPPDVLS